MGADGKPLPPVVDPLDVDPNELAKVIGQHQFMGALTSEELALASSDPAAFQTALTAKYNQSVQSAVVASIAAAAGMAKKSMAAQMATQQSSMAAQIQQQLSHQRVSGIVDTVPGLNNPLLADLRNSYVAAIMNTNPSATPEQITAFLGAQLKTLGMDMGTAQNLFRNQAPAPAGGLTAAELLGAKF
jgi:hypothetical protein